MLEQQSQVDDTVRSYVAMAMNSSVVKSSDEMGGGGKNRRHTEPDRDSYMRDEDSLGFCNFLW